MHSSPAVLLPASVRVFARERSRSVLLPLEGLQGGRGVEVRNGRGRGASGAGGLAGRGVRRGGTAPCWQRRCGEGRRAKADRWRATGRRESSYFPRPPSAAGAGVSPLPDGAGRVLDVKARAARQLCQHLAIGREPGSGGGIQPV